MLGRAFRGLLAGLLLFLATAGMGPAAYANGAVQVLAHRNGTGAGGGPPTFVAMDYGIGQFPSPNSWCLSYPAMPVAGNYAFFFLGAISNGWATPSTPTGYTLASVTAGGLTGAALFYRKLDGSESGTVCSTFNGGANNPVTVSLTLFSGMKQTGTPYESVNTGSACCNVLSASTSNIVTTGSNELAVAFWAVINTSGSATDHGSSPAPGWTNGGGDTWIASGTCGSGTCSGKNPVDYLLQASPGTVSGETRTANTSSSNVFAWASLALLGP